MPVLGAVGIFVTIVCAFSRACKKKATLAQEEARDATDDPPPYYAATWNTGIEDVEFRPEELGAAGGMAQQFAEKMRPFDAEARVSGVPPPPEKMFPVGMVVAPPSYSCESECPGVDEQYCHSISSISNDADDVVDVAGPTPTAPTDKDQPGSNTADSGCDIIEVTVVKPSDGETSRVEQQIV